MGLCSKTFVSTTPLGVTNVTWYIPDRWASGNEGSSGKEMMNCTVSSASHIEFDNPESDADSKDHDIPLFNEKGITEPHVLSIRSKITSIPSIGSISVEPMFRPQTRIEEP